MTVLHLSFVDDLSVVFPDAVLRNNTSDTGCRIYVGMPPDHGAGIADRVTAHLDIITEHGSEFFDARFHLFCSVMYHNQGFVTFYVRSNASGAHMAVITQDAVSHVIVMRGLDMIEQDYVFKLYGISHYTIGAYKG